MYKELDDVTDQIMNVKDAAQVFINACKAAPEANLDEDMLNDTLEDALTYLVARKEELEADIAASIEKERRSDYMRDAL